MITHRNFNADKSGVYNKLSLIVICLFVGLEDVFFHPQSMRTEEGHDVFLQCVSGDSSPPAQISWLKNGRVFTKGNQIQVQNYKTISHEVVHTMFTHTYWLY